MENIDLEKLDFCSVIPTIKKKNNICIFDDCQKNASYNIDGETKRLYCSTHKKDDMVNVKHKKCLDCNMLAIYNTEEKTSGLYCDIHKKYGMVNVIHTICLDCETRATFNIEGETKG